MRSAFLNDKSSFLFITLSLPTAKPTNSSCKRLSSFIGNKVPKDKESLFPKDKHEEDGIG